MNEQFAFAIAFDQQQLTENSSAEQVPWQTIITQIEQALEFEGFLGFTNPRWEEFGEGHIYWGTRRECKSLKSVLSSFPVSIYEEQNLEPGYYACSFGVYFVDDSGSILGLDLRDEPLNGFSISPLESIPLEAYKTHSIESDIEAKFQQAVLKAQETTEILSSNQKLEQPAIEDPQVSSLEVAKANQIQALERRLEQQASQLHDLQLMLDRKVDPEIHSQLQQHSAAQTEEISDLEQELQQLKQAHTQLLASESQRVSAEDYERLGQVSVAQGQTISELESKIQQLQSSLNAAHLQTESMVEAALYQAVQSERNQQSDVIANLETKTRSLNEQLQQVELQAAQKVERHEFDDLTKRANQLSGQVQKLEQTKVNLSKEVEKWIKIAEERIDSQTFETLQHKSAEQTRQLAERQDAMSQLEKELSDSKQIADKKVERSDYDAALAKIERMQEKMSRNWFERFRDWVQGT